MFASANSFNQPIGNWDVSSVFDMGDMFKGVTLSPSVYDDLLIGWSTLDLDSGVPFHGGNSDYSLSASASRQYIIDTFGWTITDGSLLQGTAPNINNPDDLSYDQGTTGNTIEWTVGDTNPDVYNVKIDSSLSIADTSWSNGTIYVDIGGLSDGTYTFSIYVYDATGNSVTDSVVVTVVDTISPNVNSPSDIVYEEGSIDNTVSWEVGDSSPNVYNVKLNTVHYIADTTWSNGNITINIDGLSVGNHTFTIYVYDMESNFASDSVDVEVVETETTSVDNTSPNVTTPSDIEYESGSTGNNVSWQVGDSNPDIYNVKLNDAHYLSDTTWSNGTIIINIDGLSVGNHTFTIYVYDTEGNSESDSVGVEVVQPQTSSEDTSEDTVADTSDTDEGFLSFNLIAIVLTLSFMVSIYQRKLRQ